jgi:hypothetical protein
VFVAVNREGHREPCEEAVLSQTHEHKQVVHGLKVHIHVYLSF